MPRRPLTDTQREILQAERSAGRLEAVRSRELAARDVAHTEARVSRESRLARGRQVRRVQSNVVETATPSGDSNIVMVVIFTMAGLIIVYQLVTRGPAFAGFLGAAGDWLSALSTTRPLFTSKPKVT